MKTLMTVFTNSRPGREADFNDWYTNVHIRDVMRFPGSIAVQRYILRTGKGATKPPHKYLAFYEIGDLAACTKGHMDNVFTSRLPISDSVEFEGVQEGYYDLVSSSKKSAFGDGAEGAFVVARINSLNGDDAALEAWFTSARLNTIAQLPGFKAAQLIRYGDEQMVMFPQSHRYVAAFRVAELQTAMDAWQNYLLVQQKEQGSIDWANAVVAAYEPLFPRLRSQNVVNPDARAAAEEKRARAALGDNVFTSFPSNANANIKEE
jgi:hypothetical protein